MRRNILDGVAMTAASVARRLIADERLASRVKTPEARRTIARQAGLTTGTLENLERGRLKFVDRVAGRLNALLVNKIEQRIQQLQHELEIARACQTLPQPDLERAEASLQEARRALGKD